jgi:hypothetical protein
VDAAKNLVTNFMGWIGNPVGLNSINLAVQLLQKGLQSDPGSTYRFLFDQQAQSIQDAHPWAQFGMDADTFHANAAKMSDTFMTLIGGDPSWLHDVGGSNLNQLYYQSLTLGLSQADIVSKLQGMSDVVAANPWLATGSTFAQSKQQYTSLYGAPPVDHVTLEDWFRFNLGSSQLQSAQKEDVISTQTKSPGTATR